MTDRDNLQEPGSRYRIWFEPRSTNPEHLVYTVKVRTIIRVNGIEYEGCCAFELGDDREVARRFANNLHLGFSMRPMLAADDN